MQRNIDNISVAVYMITYNHQKFISKAIDSVLMQGTNFNYKLIIGEDFSTDNTRDICLKYMDLYPEKIELLLNSIVDYLKQIYLLITHFLFPSMT
jgi:glycosyltransferase involved in cell wall biosynthesis